MARRRPKAPGPYLVHAELIPERVPADPVFPFTLPAVRHLGRLEFHPKVTFLVGENGSGKSTLLEAVAVECGLNPEGGSRNFRFGTRDSHSDLSKALRLAKTANLPGDAFFLRAESYFNVATEIERLGVLDHYGYRSLHEQSHGESFFALFRHRLGGPGLYLLDEPEAALSPTRQLAFLRRLHELCEAGSQLVIATHSPILLAYPDATIYVLGPNGPARTAYTDTEHYLVTRGFLTNPNRTLRQLLADDPE